MRRGQGVGREVEAGRYKAGDWELALGQWSCCLAAVDRGRIQSHVAACMPCPHTRPPPASTPLRLQATVLRLLDFEGSTTGALLCEAEAQHRKSCDTDLGGCDASCPVSHFLVSAPRVFTLQLTWESLREEPSDIAATLAAVQEEVGGPAGWPCVGGVSGAGA